MRNTFASYRSQSGLRFALALAIILTATVTTFARSSPTSAEEVLTLVPVVGGLDAPVGMANAGDGSDRLFVVERPGRIRVFDNGDLLETPFLDLTDRVHTDDSEQGLLALAFHPDYATTGELFVLYTALDWTNTVERFHVSDDPNRANRDSGEIVLAIPDREPNHNGGSLVFGPDNMLYISTGDEGGGGNPYGNAQSLSSLFGKILRIDIDSGDPYSIPSDNPFVGQTERRAEIWSLGLRNPWRMSFDRQTGDLWIADVGQSNWEEVNYVPAGTGAGRDFGWSAMEGTHCYVDDCDPSLYTLPIAEYSHADGCSITGGHVYRGDAYPTLKGRYFFGDFCSGRIWSLSPDGDDWTMTPELDTDSWITSFGEDEHGQLYLVDLAGVIYQVAATEKNVPIIVDPAIQRTWSRTDKPVLELKTGRTWIWGPEPRTGMLTEEYAESPGQMRAVQYFDKSRMEINQPNGQGDDLWYITNGLLVVEMIEGYYQTGDTQRDDTPAPAEVSIAGDLGQEPSYAYIARHNLRAATAREVGTIINQWATPDGIRDGGPNEMPEAVEITQRVTIPNIDHSIASVFVDFMNSSGVVEENGELVTDKLFENPFYATGYPITEAYWSTVLLDGAEQNVLWQCFERRCLTYNPANEPGWQVEAGNVGLHYYIWRYGEQP